MKYKQQAGELIRNLDQRMSPSIYDVAWILRLRLPDGSLFRPEYLNWLLERQHEDGSWGADIRYYHHDRIICTLACAVALSEQEQTPQIREAIRRSEVFMWQNAHLMHRDPAFTELVGYELIFPSLMDDARARGMNIPDHNFGIGELKNEKLRLIPPEMLYSRNLTTVHSLEFLGLNVSAAQLHNAVFDNGSLGNSPSATAFYLLACKRQGQTPNPAAWSYLERVLSRYDPTSYLHPFRNFEILWVLNNFMVNGGYELNHAWLTTNLLEKLEKDVERRGVSLDDEFGIPDADCTSVAYYLLGLSGRYPDPTSLTQYEVPGEKYFRTYHFERNVSVSTNIHALDALRLMPQYPGRDEVVENVTRMLLRRRRFNLFWTDKWHASPYYATAYALLTLVDGNAEIRRICKDSIDWFSHSQRMDGSWGFFNKGSMEETAYAMLALQKAYDYGMVREDILHRGAAYLVSMLEKINPQTDYEELWLGKCLYAPYDIVHSAILAALMGQEVKFGRVG